MGTGDGHMNHNTFVALEILCLCFALGSGCVLGWSMFGPTHNIWVLGVSGVLFTVFLLVTISLMMNPERIRARQSMSVLDVANRTLEALQGGFNEDSAQAVCEAIHTSTGTSAVAITNREVLLGYCGEGKEAIGQPGNAIRTAATHAVLGDGTTRILHSRAEVGLPENDPTNVQAAIVVPLMEGSEICGTLKFYYTNPRRVNANQIYIAEGFGRLISTQIAAIQVEEQKKLAASMELKALQSQINPHFLFNIINTMASLVRTDPDKARVMLREFATFYRRTLENSSDMISLSREVDQTVRYLKLEQARFSEDRLQVVVDVDDDVMALQVPSFIIQPIVENAVKHAMPAEGLLTITIAGSMDGDDAVLDVIDDGIGMTSEALDSIMAPSSQTGLGIAVKNVNDRIIGYYEAGSSMTIQSRLGEGTRVRFVLKGCCAAAE